jgi:hypothetical protein
MKMQVVVMPAWIAGIQVCKDASGNVHVNLINMKAMDSVTSVVKMRDRGGEQLWKTSHWTFIRDTRGHE